MKILVVYSSKTGNTKMIADSIFTVMPDGSEMFPVEKAPLPDGYDFIAVGYWIDKGSPDTKSLDYMKKIKGKKTALFATLGAYPDSDHAAGCIEKGRKVLEGNTVLGDFICQGKIDSKMIEWMESLPPEHPHYPDEKRRKRWAEAGKHPDSRDCEKARKIFQSIVNKL